MQFILKKFNEVQTPEANMERFQYLKPFNQAVGRIHYSRDCWTNQTMSITYLRFVHYIISSGIFSV